MHALQTLSVGWDVGRWNTEKNIFVAAWKEDGETVMKEITTSLFPSGKILQKINAHTYNDFISEALKEALGDRYDAEKTQVVLSIDAPLFYPQKFTDYFTHILAKDIPSEISYEHLAFRETERLVYAETGKILPSVTIDNAGNRASVAIVVTRMLRRLGYSIVPADEATNKQIIEVYPRILKYRKYRKLNERYSSQIKPPIYNHVAEEYYRTTSFPKPDTHELDLYDAALSALFGLDFIEHGCKMNIPADKAEVAAKEGWIYWPEDF